MSKMENKDYSKLIVAIFGEKAFENPEKPLLKTEGFNAVMEELLDTLTPEEKAAVLSTCLEGEIGDEDQSNDFAKGMRKLKHPSRSSKLRLFIQFREE